MQKLGISAVADLTFALGRVCDRCPSEVELIQSYIEDKVRHRSLKRDSDEERYVLAGEVLKDIFPDVMTSASCRGALDRIAEEFKKLPHTHPEGAQERVIGILGAIGFGLGAGAVIVGVVCLIIWAASK
jgi:hypothetical protein